MKDTEQNYLLFFEFFSPWTVACRRHRLSDRFQVVNSNLARPRLKLGKIGFGIQRLRCEQRLTFFNKIRGLLYLIPTKKQLSLSSNRVLVCVPDTLRNNDTKRKRKTWRIPRTHVSFYFPVLVDQRAVACQRLAAAGGGSCTDRRFEHVKTPTPASYGGTARAAPMADVYGDAQPYSFH